MKIKENQPLMGLNPRSSVFMTDALNFSATGAGSMNLSPLRLKSFYVTFEYIKILRDQFLLSG